MPVVEVACPGCGVKLKAPETMIGKKAKCKKCQVSFRIPGSAATAGESPPSPSNRPRDTDKTEVMMALPVDDDKTTPLPVPPTPDIASLPSADPFDFGPVKAPVTPPIKPASPKAATPSAALPAPARPTNPRSSAPPQALSLDDECDPLPLSKNSPPSPAAMSARLEANYEASAPSATPPEPVDHEPYNPFADLSPSAVEEPPPARQAKDKEKKPKEKSPQQEKQKSGDSSSDAEDPPKPRYQRPQGKRGAILALVFSGLFGIAALALGVTAVIIFQQSRQAEEQAKQDKKAEQPAPTPNDPNPPPIAKESEPPPSSQDKDPKPEPKPQPKPPAPGMRPAVVFNRLGTFTISALPDKPQLDDKPSPEQIRHLETPLSTIKRIFPPADPTTGDTYVLSQTATAVGDSGEKLALDTYGPAGNRFAEARIEYTGDGLIEPIADVYAAADGAFFLTCVGGKLHVWSLGDKPTKIADGLSPYAEKPEHAKAGVAAAFFAANPKQVILVSTAGGVLLYDLETRKPIKDFLPPHGKPGKVFLNRSIAKAPDGESIVVAVAGVLYQIAAKPDLSVLRKYDLDGDVEESKALAASGTPGRLLYVFTTIPDKMNRQERVILGLPLGDAAKPVTYHFPAGMVGEPKSAIWAGEEFGGVATERGVIWFDDHEGKFAPLVMTQVPTAGLYFSGQNHFWYTVPHAKDENKCTLIGLSMPFNSFAEFQKSGGSNRPIRSVQIDHRGLAK